MDKTAMPLHEVIAMLRHLGLLDLIPAAERELPDPAEPQDLDRFGARHGLTRDRMISRMGGSP
jgi:hypothetical protein